MKIAIVEDERAEAEKLQSALVRYGEEHQLSFEIERYESPLIFLDRYQGGYDLIFLDIQMPHYDGIETARRIRETDDQVPLIFVTNMLQRAVDGYRVQALDFIIKPLTYAQLTQTMRIAMKYIVREKPARVELKTGNQRMYVELDDILYLEVMRHRLFYHLADGRTLETWGNLGDAEKQMPENQFARCNNCYLVNLKHVREVGTEQIRVGQDSLKMSRGRRAEFMEKMMDYR